MPFVPPQVALAKTVLQTTVGMYRAWNRMPPEIRSQHGAQFGRVASLSAELLASLGPAAAEVEIPDADLKVPDGVPVGAPAGTAPRATLLVAKELGATTAALASAIGVELTADSSTMAGRALHRLAKRGAKKAPPLAPSPADHRGSGRAMLTSQLSRTGRMVGGKVRQGVVDRARDYASAKSAGTDPSPKHAVVAALTALAPDDVLEVSSVEAMAFADGLVGHVLLVVTPTALRLVEPAGDPAHPPRVIEKAYVDHRGIETSDAGGPCVMLKPEGASDPVLLSWPDVAERDRVAAAIVSAWRAGPTDPEVSVDDGRR
ncbi:MAG: hypothetical protein AAGC46_00375 [Solirubrobacteraceae bacterium]|nr:hypothetical protein [Patulibacter sp.]